MSECFETPECTCDSCVNECHWCGGSWDDPAHRCKASVIQKLVAQTALVPKAVQIEMLEAAIEQIKTEVIHG